MKECPACGYVPTIRNQQMMKLFAQHFPGLPIWEMIKRQWISLSVWTVAGEQNKWHENEIPQLLEHILKELMTFAGVKTVDELKEVFGWEGDLMTV